MKRQMHGEESNLFDKDYLRRRGPPLKSRPAAALGAAADASATIAQSMLKSVDLANVRKRKDASHRDINPLVNTISEGCCVDDMHRDIALGDQGSQPSAHQSVECGLAEAVPWLQQ